MAQLLEPYLAGEAPPPALLPRLHDYLSLLLRWNARTNLTAIRDPEEIVRRHFGESLFVAKALSSLLAPGSTLLDYGSGAGFPGLPIALWLPEVRVTLAESQGKKASFLREAVRVLGVDAQVWAKRVEDMPDTTRFHAVTLRAVDDMQAALAGSASRVAPGGVRAILGGAELIANAEVLQVPGSRDSFLYLGH